MKKQAQTDGQDRNETMNRVKELQDFIKKQKTKITDFDESQVKTLIQRITVFPGYLVVAFKSGVSVDITEEESSSPPGFPEMGSSFNQIITIT